MQTVKPGEMVNRWNGFYSFLLFIYEIYFVFFCGGGGGDEAFLGLHTVNQGSLIW